MVDRIGRGVGRGAQAQQPHLPVEAVVKCYVGTDGSTRASLHLGRGLDVIRSK